MKRLAIIGSNDLALLIAHHALQSGEFKIAGFFDNRKEIGLAIQDFGQVIGNSQEILTAFEKKIFDELIVGVGYTQFDFRKESFDAVADKVPMATIIHPSAYVDPSCKIGRGVVILPGCILDNGVDIENNVLLNTGVAIAHHSTVKSHSFIGPRANIAGHTVVGSSCFVGIGSTIVDHLTICDHVQIGAASLIVKSIHQPGSYYGHPAKIITN